MKDQHQIAAQHLKVATIPSRTWPAPPTAGPVRGGMAATFTWSSLSAGVACLPVAQHLQLTRPARPPLASCHSLPLALPDHSQHICITPLPPKHPSARCTQRTAPPPARHRHRPPPHFAAAARASSSSAPRRCSVARSCPTNSSRSPFCCSTAWDGRTGRNTGWYTVLLSGQRDRSCHCRKPTTLAPAAHLLSPVRHPLDDPPLANPV